MAEKSVDRVVFHGLFDYKNPDTGSLTIAFKGDHIKVLPPDAERGEKAGAFLTEGQATAAFPAGGSLEDRQQWLADHTVDQAVDSLRQDRSGAAAMQEAEQSRGSAARTTLLQVLGSVLAS